MYTTTDTTAEMTALMDVEAMFQASVISAAGFPRITSLYRYPTSGSAITLKIRPPAAARDTHLNTFARSLHSVILPNLCAISPVISPMHSFSTKVFGA